MDWVADRAKAMAAAIFASTEDDNSVSGSIDGAGEAVVADMLPSVKPLSIYGETYVQGLTKGDDAPYLRPFFCPAFLHCFITFVPECGWLVSFFGIF